MFRFAFVLLILAVSIYSLVALFWPLQNAQESENFDSYLAEALERNTVKKETFDVVIETKEILNEDDIKLIQKNYPYSILDQNYNGSNDIMNGLNNSFSQRNQYENREHSPLSMIKETKNTGNFWTPDVSAAWGAVLFDDSCHGIIFDPCLVVWNPIPANGWMDFWEWRVTYNL